MLHINECFSDISKLCHVYNLVFFMPPDGSGDKAVLKYQWVKKGVVDMHHTGVPPRFRGQGIAKILAKVPCISFA